MTVKATEVPRLLRLPVKLDKQLKLRAEAERRSINAQALIALEEHLKAKS